MKNIRTIFPQLKFEFGGAELILPFVFSRIWPSSGCRAVTIKSLAVQWLEPCVPSACHDQAARRTRAILTTLTPVNLVGHTASAADVSTTPSSLIGHLTRQQGSTPPTSQQDMLPQHGGRKLAQRTMHRGCGAPRQMAKQARMRCALDALVECQAQIVDLLQAFTLSSEVNLHSRIRPSIRPINAGIQDQHGLKLIDLVLLNPKQAERISRRRAVRDRLSPIR